MLSAIFPRLKAACSPLAQCCWCWLVRMLWVPAPPAVQPNWRRPANATYRWRKHVTPNRRLISFPMLLCASVLSAGCAVKTPQGNYCDIAKPIWWDNAAQLDATPTPVVRQIVAHNETVGALCQ